MELDNSENLNRLKEIILDEEKLVSYVSLSKDLCIHVNSSKELLNCAVKKIREENPDIQLNVTFIISGCTEDNKARTTICSEDEVDKLRKTFKNVFFNHIYSVNKGLKHIDSTTFMLLSRFDDFNLCTGLIKSKECNKRSADEIGNLKCYSQEKKLTDANSSVSHKNNKQESNNGSKLASKNGHDQKNLVNNGRVKTEQISPKKEVNKVTSNKISHANNSFEEKSLLNGVKVNAEKVSPKKESNKQTSIKDNNQKAQKSIAGFFNKPANSATTSNNKPSKKDLKDNSKVPKIEIKIKEEKMEVEETDTSIKTDVKEIKNKDNSKQKDKVLNHIKKSCKVDKKRKRVLHVSDSESDEENDPFVDKEVTNHESDDEIPPTPSTNNNIKITSGIMNPKKRRKIVDKTYTDEDGYILTKKEEVYESCSENEEDTKKEIKIKNEEKKEISPPEKKSIPKSSKKKISPPQKGKQATLTNFFKKI